MMEGVNNDDSESVLNTEKMQSLYFLHPSLDFMFNLQLKEDHGNEKSDKDDMKTNKQTLCLGV